MTYLKFDKTKLINLEYSLNKEIIRSNRAGSYASTTLIGCNTRKYHGWLVCPMDNLDGERHVLLSSLDETVIQHGSEFNLGIHKYSGDNYFPKGHKYIRDFEAEYVAKSTYRVGGVILTKESLLVEKEEQIIFKYTLVDAHSPTWLRFKPFLAFRNMHQLTRANMDANTHVEYVKNGIKIRLYNGYPYLHMQFNKPAEFVPVPDWYYNIEYIEEQRRGYDYKEDLFVPGYFEVPIKKGEEVLFSASTKEVVPSTLKRKYQQDISKRIPRNSYKNCLLNSAQQFIVKKEKKTEILAGFHWFGSWGRDTFVSLPGLTLTIGDYKTFKAVMETQIAQMKGGLFPNMGTEDSQAFNSVDAPLWYFWALQQYYEATGEYEEIWTRCGKNIKAILKAFKDGLPFHIKLHDNGLIYGGEPGYALTWMDAVVHGKPVTPRYGYDVEINGLWYNAVMFSLDLARKMKDTHFISQWKHLPELTKKSFLDAFWDKTKGYCADYVEGGFKDFAVRPNMVIAASLKFTPLEPDMIKSILDVTKKELLTSRGLRTLSPSDPAYKGIYEGDQATRDAAYHQGTAWPWLLQHFCEAYLRLYRKSGLSLVKDIYNAFEPDMVEQGIGTISEIYDGDPPHYPKGAISQAWSVAALLRIDQLIQKYEQNDVPDLNLNL